MTKLLSLKNQEIHIQPRSRLSAKEFSTLKTATTVLKEAKQERADLLEETKREAEKIRKKAYEEGKQEGLTSFNRHLLHLDRELLQIRTDLQKKILPLAIKAARKIVGDELESHPDRIVDIVLSSLKQVTQHKSVIIYVNKEDLPRLEKQRGKIRKIFEHLQSLKIQERSDVEIGGCIIETEAGIINAELEKQWEALEAAFKQFTTENG